MRQHSKTTVSICSRVADEVNTGLALWTAMAFLEWFLATPPARPPVCWASRSRSQKARQNVS